MAIRDAAYEVLRPYLSKALGLSSRSLARDAPLDLLIPRTIRRQVWLDIEANMGIRLPRLWFSPAAMLSVALLGAGLWLIVVGVVVWFGSRIPANVFPYVVLLVIALAPVTVGIATRLLAHQATWLPNVGTLLELAEMTARMNMRPFRERYGVRPSQREFLEIVRSVLVDTLGVDESEVKRESRLVQDLGAE